MDRQGEGIWRVELKNPKKYQGAIPLDAELKLTEAKDNHTETKTLQDYLEFCIQYLEGNSGYNSRYAFSGAN